MRSSNNNAFLRNYTLKINPNEKIEFGLRGNTVRVVAATCTLFFETKDGNSSFYLTEGEQAVFTNTDFLAIEIFHNEVTEQAIVLAVSENATIGSAKVSGLVQISSIKNNGAITQNRVSLTNVNQQILAANTNRKYLLIQNNDAVAVMRVNLAGVAATAAQGFRIAAGDSMELNNFNVTSAINVIMETATAAAGNVEFSEG